MLPLQVRPTEYVQTCLSGTAALYFAVAAADIGPCDEGISSPNTDMGAVIGILFQRAVTVFADLRPDTYKLDRTDAERRMTPKTIAITTV